MNTDMYKALNKAWEEQKQDWEEMETGPTFQPTWGSGFKAGWKAGLTEKEEHHGRSS